jgi:hypothetical protein
VASLAKKQTTNNGRYRVDLDLLDGNKPYIGLKPQSLQREAALPLPDDDDGDGLRRAGAANGILTEDYGRPMSVLLDFLRLVVATVFRPHGSMNNDINDSSAWHNEGCWTTRSHGPQQLDWHGLVALAQSGHVSHARQPERVSVAVRLGAKSL